MLRISFIVPTPKCFRGRSYLFSSVEVKADTAIVHKSALIGEPLSQVQDSAK